MSIEERLITRYERYWDKFEATGEPRYLDIALHADRMLRRVRGVAR